MPLISFPEGNEDRQLSPQLYRSFLTQFTPTVAKIIILLSTGDEMIACGSLISENGLVVTIHRLVHGVKRKNISVIVEDVTYKVEEIFCLPPQDSDLAILKLRNRGGIDFNYVGLATDEIFTGQSLQVMIFPFGLNPILLPGSIYCKHRLFSILLNLFPEPNENEQYQCVHPMSNPYYEEKNPGVIQIATSLAPGNHSGVDTDTNAGMIGAPFLNNSGELVGLYSFRLKNNDYALPLKEISKILQEYQSRNDTSLEGEGGSSGQ